jgi:hypothetical protein
VSFRLLTLGRSFDQRSHTYLGYALRVRGNFGSEVREFLVGVGEGAHAKHQFQVGDTISGEALPVADPRLETVEFYKIESAAARKSKDRARVFSQLRFSSGRSSRTSFQTVFVIESTQDRLGHNLVINRKCGVRRVWPVAGRTVSRGCLVRDSHVAGLGCSV